MKIYMPAVLNKWDSIRSSDGEDRAIEMQGKSIGYICVYAEYDDCKAEFPDRDVIAMETAT